MPMSTRQREIPTPAESSKMHPCRHADLGLTARIRSRSLVPLDGTGHEPFEG